MNRGIYRCGICGERGHTRDTHPGAKPIKRVPGWKYGNGNYRHNRSIGACDDCGRPSKRASRCPACTRVRNSRPSRGPEARRAYNELRRARRRK